MAEPMLPEMYRKVRQVFDEASDLPEAKREEFVQSVCAGDDVLCETVTRLLRAQSPSRTFLEDRARSMRCIGRYLVSGELGRGGMGVVYEAEDPLIRRKVALKVIRLEALADSPEAGFLRERLFREARSSGQLLHPGIVIIFDVGQEGELAYIAMERVHGQSLQQILESRRKFTGAEAVDILRQTAVALDYAHGRGIVHCDVKPGNIMMDANGVVKLTDFGIAKITSSQNLTRSGLLMGTPSYMSPEQIEARPVDGRSDQFSLGVVAFQLLTGRMAFREESIAALAHAIVYGPRPSLKSIDVTLPAGVDPVFARVLDQNRERRFGSCTEFVASLEGALTALPVLSTTADASSSAGVGARPAAPAGASPVGARSRRNKTPIAIGICLAVVVSLASASFYLVYRPSILAKRIVTPPPVATIETPPVAPPPAPPPILEPEVVQFSVDPPVVKKGTSATLQWEVKNVVSVTIQPDIGMVDASGSAKVNPKATTVYTLTASVEGGQPVTKVALLAVDKAPDRQTIYAQAMSERRIGRLENAIELLHQASDMGEPRAMRELGAFSEDGIDMPKSYPQALEWYRMAANLGDLPAMVRLGGLYYLGEGVKTDYAEAVFWFGKAADSGDASGKFDMGMVYENGQGVPRDLDKAQQYYRDAAKLGLEEAKRKLTRLALGH